jgi:hypothetical protein
MLAGVSMQMAMAVPAFAILESRHPPAHFGQECLRSKIVDAGIH